MSFKWLTLILLIPVLCQAQQHRIDSLTKLLPTLKDSSRIDCLNKLSVEYYINALAETYINVQTDTAISLASKAYNESVKIHYTKGVAEALQNLGEIARDRGNFIAAENYFRRSIPLFEKTNAMEKYSWANLTLGWSLYMQCKFSDSKKAYERAILYYSANNMKEKESMLFRLISSTYGARGYYEKAFENTLKALRITFKISDPRGIISSPENMANLYKNAGEHEIALKYFRLAAQNAKPINPIRYKRLLGDIAMLRHQLDSAIYYYNDAHNYLTLSTSDTAIIQRSISIISVRIGEIYMTHHKYDQAIKHFKNALERFEKGNDRINMMRIFQRLAKCYYAQQNLSLSSLYTKRLIVIAQRTGSRPFVRDAYESYWNIYDKQGLVDSAYKYNLKFTAIKDSIASDEYRRNIALSEMRSKDEQQKIEISLLQKDQDFNKEKLLLQQQQINSESVIRYILFAVTGSLVLIGIFIFRNNELKRKNEKQHLEHALEMQQLQSKKTTIEFQKQATDLEMQALRAQMNPHFIFNCLSSINRYILINKTEEASEYLTKFSRLIRMSLYNSEKSFITLESELEALRLYLDLERLRFKNAFSYKITFINTIDIHSVYISPLLIQPFAENAIWHGLMHKKGVGHLEIQLCAEGKTLICTIIDNGIGRNMAAALKSRSAEKNKSMGVSITAGRLALLNKSSNEDAVLNIEDIFDEDGGSCGTKVVLTMPYKDLTEVVV